MEVIEGYPPHVIEVGDGRPTSQTLKRSICADSESWDARNQKTNGTAPKRIVEFVRDLGAEKQKLIANCFGQTDGVVEVPAPDGFTGVNPSQLVVEVVL